MFNLRLVTEAAEKWKGDENENVKNESNQSIYIVHQGCRRPRPNPFERPSTRYDGVTTPWGGGGRLQDSGPREVVRLRVFGFLVAKRPKRLWRRCFWKWWRFLDNFTKLMYSKSTKIAFQGHFGRTQTFLTDCTYRVPQERRIQIPGEGTCQRLISRGVLGA